MRAYLFKEGLGRFCTTPYVAPKAAGSTVGMPRGPAVGGAAAAAVRGEAAAKGGGGAGVVGVKLRPPLLAALASFASCLPVVRADDSWRLRPVDLMCVFSMRRCASARPQAAAPRRESQLRVPLKNGGGVFSGVRFGTPFWRPKSIKF